MKKSLGAWLAKQDESNQLAMQQQNESAGGTWEEYAERQDHDPRTLHRVRWARWVILMLILGGVLGMIVALVCGRYVNRLLVLLLLAGFLGIGLTFIRQRRRYWP